MADFLNSFTARAAKIHTCVECDRPIDEGEFYSRTKGLHEDIWITFAQCAHCTAVYALYLDRYVTDPEERPERGALTTALTSDYPFDHKMASSLMLKWRGVDGELLPIPTIFEGDALTEQFATTLLEGMTADL